MMSIRFTKKRHQRHMHIQKYNNCKLLIILCILMITQRSIISYGKPELGDASITTVFVFLCHLQLND